MVRGRSPRSPGDGEAEVELGLATVHGHRSSAKSRGTEADARSNEVDGEAPAAVCAGALPGLRRSALGCSSWAQSPIPAAARQRRRRPGSGPSAAAVPCWWPAARARGPRSAITRKRFRTRRVRLRVMIVTVPRADAGILTPARKEPRRLVRRVASRVLPTRASSVSDRPNAMPRNSTTVPARPAAGRSVTRASACAAAGSVRLTAMTRQAAIEEGDLLRLPALRRRRATQGIETSIPSILVGPRGIRREAGHVRAPVRGLLVDLSRWRPAGPVRPDNASRTSDSAAGRCSLRIRSS